MIGTLMREQARAHRAYLGWTSALLTLAVALAGYAAFTAAQQSTVEDHVSQTYGLSGAWTRTVSLNNAYEASMTWEELTRALDAADAEGAATAAVHWGWAVDLSATVAGGETWSTMETAGVRGAVDWDTLLVSGTAPGAGEVALGEGWHSRGGLQIGDTVDATGWIHDPSGEGAEVDLGSLTVSGFVRDGADGRYVVSPIDAVVEWNTSYELWSRWLTAQQEVVDDQWGTTVEIGAEAVTPSLESIPGSTSWRGWAAADSLASAAGEILAITAAVLALGMIGTSFAIGRSQAQVRSQWVATARVLGARRWHVATATVLEALLMGLIAGAAGVLIAWSAVTVEYAGFVAAHPDALLPSGVDLPLSLVAGIASLGLVMAVILGAIPAFWAARVTPAAALKPVRPVSEAQLSPTVSRRWPYGMWAVVSGLTVAVAWAPDASAARVWATSTLALAAGVATVAALVQASRDLVWWAGARLSRSTRPWALAAGDALVGRSRAAAIPAAVVAIGTAALTGVLSWTVLTEWGEYLPDTFGWGYEWLPRAFQVPALWPERVYVGTVVLTLGALVLAALAAFVSSVRASAAEESARRALGLSAGAARVAMAVRFAVPLALGALIGTVTGVLAVLLTFHGMEIDQTIPIDVSGEIASQATGPAWAITHAGHLLLPTLGVLAVAAAWIAVGAAVAALATATTRARAAA